MKAPLQERKRMNDVAFAAYRAARHHEAVGTEHLLLAIVQQDDGPAGQALRELGITEERVAPFVDALLAPSEEEALASASIDAKSLREDIENQFGDKGWRRPWRRRRRVMQIHGATEGYRGTMVETMLGPPEERTTRHLVLRLIETGDRGLEIIRSLGVTPEEIRRKLPEQDRHENSYPTSLNGYAMWNATARALRKLFG